MGQKSILFKIFGVTCLSLAAFFVYQVANVRGFTNPTCNPPNCTGSLGGATSGNLGIGTTNPVGLLHIASTTATDVKMVIERASDVNKSAVLKFNTGAVSNWSIGLVSNTSGSKFGISTDNTLASSKFVIDPTTGYVGIGTTAPGYMLDVAGDINYTGTLRYNGTAFSGSQWLNSSPNIYYTAGTVSVGLSGTDANYKIITSGGGIKAENTSASQPTGYFNNIGSGPSIVTGTGNVGIGTTAPAARLDIASSYATGLRFNVTGFQTQNIQSRGTPDNVGFYHSNIEFGRDASTYSYGSYISLKTEGKASGTTDASAERMRITSTGNVGIGTTAPGGILHTQKLAADADHVFDVYSDNNGNVARLKFRRSLQDTIGYTANSSGSYLGSLEFYGVNSTNTAWGRGAEIRVTQDGSAGATYVPGKMTFLTSDGSANQVERMVIDKSGNVGIGTTAPGTPLHVNSLATGGYSILALQHSAATDGTQEVIQYRDQGGSSTWGISALNVNDATATADFGITTRANSYSTKFIVKDSGNVGIGTTAPNTNLETIGKFQVKGSSGLGPDGGGTAAGEGLHLTYVDASDTGRVSSYTGTANGTLQLLGNDIQLWYGAGLQGLTLNSSGNVGIGTTAPAYKLQVVGTLDATTITQGGLPIGSAGWTSATGKVYTTTLTDNVGIGTTNPSGKLTIASAGTGTDAESDASILFKSSTTIPKILRFQGHAGASDLLIYEPASVADIRIGKTTGSATTDLVTFQVGGSVGIGLTSPDTNYKLTTTAGGVKAENSSASQPSIYASNAGGGPALVTGSGNVGIGTTAPLASVKLHIKEPSATAAFMALEGGQVGDANWLLASGYPSIGDFSIREANVQTSLTIKKTTGNVGIGITAPTQKLTVNGSIYNIGNYFTGNTGGYWAYGDGSYNVGWQSNADNQMHFYTNATEKMTIQSGGNVGIGITAPVDKLEVAGRLVSNAPDTYTDMTAPYQNSMGIRIKNTSATANNYGSLVFLDAAGGFTGGLAVQTTDQTNHYSKMYLYTRGSNGFDPRLTIDNIGNIGIGITNPSEKLAVYGANYTTAASRGQLFVHTSDAQAANIGGTVAMGGFATTGGTTPYVFGSISGRKLNSTTADYTGYLAFGAAYSSSEVQEHMRIVGGTGYVGIGTTNPVKKLDIVGSARVVNSSDTGAEVTGTGASNYAMFVTASNATNGYGLAVRAGNGTSNTLDIADFADRVGNSKVSIKNNGNVGIGTATPSGKLNMAYTVDTAPLTYTNGGNEGLVINATRSTAGTYYRGTVDFVAGRGSDPTNGGSTFRFFTQPRTTGAPAEALTIQYNGTVGIGVTNPDSNYKLTTTAGGGKFENNDATNPAGYFDNLGAGPDIEVKTGGIKFSDGTTQTTAGTGGWTSATGKIYTTTLTDSVGIGTTAPGAQLDITRGSGVLGLKVNYDYGTGVAGSYTSANIIANYGSGSSGAVTGLKIDTTNTGSGATYGLLVNGGNVGIGTTAPGALLALSGAVTTGITNAPTLINVLSTNSQAVNMGGGIMLGGVYTGTSQTAFGYIGGLKENGTDNNYSGKLVFGARTNGGSGGDMTRMTILGSNGNVGIGTTAPGNKLEISGSTPSFINVINTGTSYLGMQLTGVSTGGMYMEGNLAQQLYAGSLANAIILGNATSNAVQFAPGNSVKMTLLAGGNVGIGTTAPGYKLDVQDTALVTQFKSTTGTNYLYTQWANGSGNMYVGKESSTGGAILGGTSAYAGVLGVSGAYSLQLGTSNAVKMTIDSSGNVGIGTTNPSTKLHIASTGTNVASILIDASANTDSRGAQVVYSAKNSGLTVGGWTTGLNVVSSENNFEFYNGAAYPFRIINSGSVNNTLVVSGGGVGIGTASPDANYKLTTSGGGIKAESTTQPAGYFNSTSGYGLLVNTGNVGIGTTAPGAKLDVAGRIWQTGTGQSVFLGEGAGASDDLSNNWNVFVGYQAGYSNTIGALNTASGWQALYSNTTGSRNTASGLYALYSNTTSSFNTASGYQALSSSTGGNNTGFGNLAGNAITSGTNNTFLGSEAGYGASQLATAVNSMALGYGAVTTANNQVVIGNTSITQTLLNGNVGIGTTNPTAKLEVNGSVAVLGVPASKAFDTVYQATTDGIVTAYKNCIDGGYLEMQLEGLIGSVNPPTTRINFARMTYIPGNGSSRTINVTFPVKKGYYWKAQFNYTGTIGTCNFVEVYFTPIGVE